MTARRNFLKGAGIVSAFVVGAAAYKQVKEIAESSKDISHLAPPGNAYTLQIQGTYGEPPPAMRVSADGNVGIGSSFYITPYNQPVTNKVSMTVGKDDRLWIKVGDEWRRVALEG